MLPAIVVDQADLAADRRQALVGVVAAQMQPMLGAAGEHAVRLGRRLGDQVVDQHADVRLVAPQDEIGYAAGGVSGGVDAGDEALGGGLFVAAGAVDLPGEEQAGDLLRLQRRADLRRPDHVVFDRVAVAAESARFPGRG